MTPETWGVLKTRLEIMEGFPQWSAQMGDNYFMELQDVPESVAVEMGRGVMRQFDKRPSVKQLRDWAHLLAPKEPFDIKRLLSAPSCAKRLTAPVNSVEEYAASIVPKAARSRLIEQIRKKAEEAPQDTRPEYGLQFLTVSTGRITRTPVGYSLFGAQKKAEERNDKWSHVVTTVFHKDDPMPHQPTEQADEAQEVDLSGEVPEMADACLPAQAAAGAG